MISPLPGITATKPGSAMAPLPGISAKIVDDDEPVSSAPAGNRLPGARQAVAGDAARHLG